MRVAEQQPRVLTTPAKGPATAPRETSPAGSVGHLLELHRTHGNAMVCRLIQCKLAVSQPGDPYEEEAERVSREVMRDPVPVADDERDEEVPPVVQRVAAADGVRRASAADDVGEVDGPVESGIRAIAGGGMPLAPAARTDMEARLGVGFDAVRVHTDANAAHLARSVNALAFTTGNDIVFGDGQYRPDDPEGKRLLAHELTHVVQQTGGTERKAPPRGGRE